MKMIKHVAAERPVKMIENQEDEVVKFWLHTGLLTNYSKSDLLTSMVRKRSTGLVPARHVYVRATMSVLPQPGPYSVLRKLAYFFLPSFLTDTDAMRPIQKKNSLSNTKNSISEWLVYSNASGKVVQQTKRGLDLSGSFCCLFRLIYFSQIHFGSNISQRGKRRVRELSGLLNLYL